jgi:hypothetical protein
MEQCDQVVMDFLAATHVGKFRPKQEEEFTQEECGQESECLVQEWTLVSLISFILLNCLLFLFPGSKGTTSSRWEFCHLAGSPGGRGGVSRICHT